MKKIRTFGLLFFCIIPLFLSACSYKEFEDSFKSKLHKNENENTNLANIPNNSPETEKKGLFSVGDTISFTYPGNETVQYTLKQVHVSDNINDVGLNAADFRDTSLVSANGDIDKKYRLVTVDVRVENVDSEGFEHKGEDPMLFIEECVGFKDGIEDPNGPWLLYASYFSEHPPLDQNNGEDYSTFLLAIGDEMDASVGWFVPTDQLEKEPLFYIIGYSGMPEDFQYFELKFD